MAPRLRSGMNDAARAARRGSLARPGATMPVQVVAAAALILTMLTGPCHGAASAHWTPQPPLPACPTSRPTSRPTSASPPSVLRPASLFRVSHAVSHAVSLPPSLVFLLAAILPLKSLCLSSLWPPPLSLPLHVQHLTETLLSCSHRHAGSWGVRLHHNADVRAG